MSRQEIIDAVNAHESGGDLESAKKILDEALSVSEDSEYYYLRGRLNWRLGNRGAAMSDYRSSVSLNPDSPAVQALEMTKGIMDFYNHDLYNP